MITTEQLFRHIQPFKLARPGVLAMLEQAAAESIIGCGIRTAKYAGQYPGYGIHHNHGCKLATSENIVTYGEFFINILPTKTFINAFITAADKHQFFKSGKPFCSPLVVARTPWREQDHPALFPGLNIS